MQHTHALKLKYHFWWENLALNVKRRWCNGQHRCLPSNGSGFDSRPSHILLPNQLTFFVRFILVARSITPVRPSQTYIDGDIEPSTFLCQKRELWLTRWQRDKCEKNNQRHTYAAAIQVLKTKRKYTVRHLSFQGIRRAGHECKVRFRNELWNCPDLHSELKNHLHDESSIFSFGECWFHWSVFTWTFWKSLFSGTKQAAYANAILAASVTHSVSLGTLATFTVTF